MWVRQPKSHIVDRLVNATPENHWANPHCREIGIDNRGLQYLTVEAYIALNILFGVGIWGHVLG